MPIFTDFMETSMDLPEQIRKISEKRIDAAGRTVAILYEAQAFKLSAEFNCTIRSVYIEAMNQGICPFRYIRNQDEISIREQIKLAESTVSVVGSGGLGGHSVLLLGRLGIGCINIIDCDVFDETNLNRQAVSNVENIGKSKSRAAACILETINPAVDVGAFSQKLVACNAVEILEGSHVIVDALDNVKDRFILEDSARKLNIPFVHGAVAGFEGRIMTVFPGDRGLELLEKKKQFRDNDSKGAEVLLGVPSITPAVVGAYQAMEVVKIILDRGTLFRDTMVYVDLVSGKLDKFSFKDPSNG